LLKKRNRINEIHFDLRLIFSLLEKSANPTNSISQKNGDSKNKRALDRIKNMAKIN